MHLLLLFRKLEEPGPPPLAPYEFVHNSLGTSSRLEVGNEDLRLEIPIIGKVVT